MFKDDFITIARAHHLSLSTERSYWDCARRHIKWLGVKSVKDLERDPTAQFRNHLTELANVNGNRTEGDEGVSASTQNLFFHSLRFLYEKVVGVKLDDLSGIPKATGHERIVDVPDSDTAAKIVNEVAGSSARLVRAMFNEAIGINEAIRRFKPKLHQATVHRAIKDACIRLRIRKKYTPTSIRLAGARVIALRKGFLAAHEALGSQSTDKTKKVLGKTVLANLARRVTL